MREAERGAGAPRMWVLWDEPPGSHGETQHTVAWAPEIPFGALRWVKTQGAGRWLDKGLVKAGTLNTHKKGTRMDGGTEVNTAEMTSAKATQR